MKKMKTKIGLTVGVVVLSFLVFTASAAAQTNINVESATVDSGDTFTINVTLSNTPASGISAYGFNVTFDHSVVQVKNVTNLPAGYTISNWNNDTGWVKFGGALTPAKGDGVFGTVTFEATGASGTSATLDMTVEDLTDGDNVKIPEANYTVTDGSVTVGVVTKTSVTVESKTVGEGETTTIDVTLSNTPASGISAYGFNVTFDHSVVQVKNVTNLPAGYTISNWNNDTGWVKFGGALTPAKGDGVFGTVTFEATGASGTSTALDLTVEDLTDGDNVKIPEANYTVTNGSVTVGVPTVKVVINEFMSNNATEWVELFNNGSTAVDLAVWTLEDEAGNSKSLTGLGTIAVGGYKVFTYSGTWLNNDGDVIWLNSTTENIDRVGYDGTSGGAPAPDAGNSTGRYPNGVDTDNDANDFTEFGTPTQGAENVELQKDGNIDGIDGVNMQDAIYLVKYLYHIPGFEDLHADGNIDSADGVNMQDAIYLVKHLYHIPGYEELYP